MCHFKKLSVAKVILRQYIDKRMSMEYSLNDNYTGKPKYIEKN